QGQYVIVGDNLPPNGTMLTSSNGVNWSRRPQFIGKNLRSVQLVNNALLATANDETFIISTNGAPWEFRTTGIYPGYGQNLRAATYASGVWLQVGNEGTVVTSLDGTNWTHRSVPTIENLHGVTFLNNRFIVMGNRGTILQSDSLVAPAILSGLRIPGGFRISVTGTPGASYQVQSIDALTLPQWTNIGTVTLQQTTTNFLDARAVSTQRYYRVISP